MGKRLVFPAIVQTTLRPDIVLWSKTGKKLIATKLTVLWVARCEEAYERREQSTQRIPGHVRVKRLAYLVVLG